MATRSLRFRAPSVTRPARVLRTAAAPQPPARCRRHALSWASLGFGQKKEGKNDNPRGSKGQRKQKPAGFGTKPPPPSPVCGR
eukprot:scaffold1315_cov405-Prasinococcus_capsulatus_cf.AAC.13